MRRHCGQIALVGAPGEQAAVDLRVQRLNPPVHHFGKAGMIGNLDHCDAGIAQGFGGAAGG